MRGEDRLSPGEWLTMIVLGLSYGAGAGLAAFLVMKLLGQVFP